MIRILVADNHAIMRRGLRGLLETHADWHVCGEAGNGREAVEMTMRLAPEVVVLDLTMPELHGLDAAKAIRAAVPATEVLIFTMHESEELIRAALASGVRAVVVKSREGRETFERIRPILEDIGPTVTHVGPNGQAALMKIATNLGLAVQMLAFSEAVLLAEKGGIARETAVRVLTSSAIASPMVKYRGPFVLEQPEEPWFDVGMMQKDMRLALEAGRRLDVPLPTTAATNELLTAARAMGLGSYDFAIVFDVLAAMAGVSVSRDGHA